jgi:hypothetical protein
MFVTLSKKYTFKHLSQTTEPQTILRNMQNKKRNKRLTDWGGGRKYEAAPAGLGAPPCRSPVPCFRGS